MLRDAPRALVTTARLELEAQVIVCASIRLFDLCRPGGFLAENFDSDGISKPVDHVFPEQPKELWHRLRAHARFDQSYLFLVPPVPMFYGTNRNCLHHAEHPLNLQLPDGPRQN